MPDASADLAPEPAGASPAPKADPDNPAPAAGSFADPAAPAPAARKRRGYFLPGFIALAALLLIGGAFGAGDLSHPAPRALRGSDVAAQISFGVQEQQGDPAPPQVTCPRSEPVRAGLRFGCTLVTASGRPVPVAVTEVDGRGRLQWSLGSVGSVGVAPPAK